MWLKVKKLSALPFVYQDAIFCPSQEPFLTAACVAIEHLCTIAGKTGSKTICRVVPGKILRGEPYVASYVRVDVPFKEIAFIVVKGGIHRQHEFPVHVQDHAGCVVLSFAARDRSGLQNNAGSICELLLADSNDFEFVMFHCRFDIFMQPVEYMTETNLGDRMPVAFHGSRTFRVQ